MDPLKYVKCIDMCSILNILKTTHGYMNEIQDRVRRQCV